MADILKQIKVGNTIYNIEPYTAYLPLAGGTIDAGGLKAPLILKGGASDWNEGLRIVPSGNWATIMLGGNDITETTGTSANSWSIHNNDGRFFISKNGSDYATTKLSNTDGTWRVNDNDIIHSGNIGSQNVNYANSAGSANSVSWDNISSKPITITQRNNDSPVSGAYAWGTHVTMRNANNWFEIYAPHMGTSSSRVYMQTGWDNDRQGWKESAWTSDIPTSLPANDVYAWAKSPTKPSYTKSEVGLGNVDNTADANKNVNYANSANYFNYGRGVTLANSSSFTNNFCKDIFGEENNNNYHLVELRTNSQAPSCLFGDYSSGIAWKGSDTYGSLMVRYSTSEIRVSGGNGANTNPKWTVDLVHSGNIGSQNVNYANSAGSVAWGNVTGKPTNFVITDDTDQTINGTKTFSKRVMSNGGFGCGTGNNITTYKSKEISRVADTYTYDYYLPDKSGTFAMTTDLSSYLPLSGGSLTGTLDLASSASGIKFGSSSWYVTNMESGSVSVSLGASSGTEASKNVSFHNGSKGNGTWHVVATADGVLSDNVSIGITNIRSSGFTIWVKNVIAASSRTLTLHYIALKYH